MSDCLGKALSIHINRSSGLVTIRGEDEQVLQEFVLQFACGLQAKAIGPYRLRCEPRYVTIRVTRLTCDGAIALRDLFLQAASDREVTVGIELDRHRIAELLPQPRIAALAVLTA